MTELYEIAEEDNITITYGDFPICKAFSIPGHIALDYSLSNCEERVCAAHELGHCETGSFYTQYTPCVYRQRYENRADKWAIKKLIPKDELDEAVRHGHTEIYDLAEFFDVTEDFMRKAVCLYKYGSLNTEYYFAS